MPSYAALYLRISEDRDGEQVAIERQRTETLQLAEQLGVTNIREYVDNDVSATTGAARPEFDRMLAERPSVILAWAQDRLLRLTTDLERVIELGVNVHTVVAGTLDLSTPAGRAVARTVAAWSTYEGEQKSLRQRAKNRQTVASGRPLQGGKRRFGYLADHITPHPDEAPLVAEAYQLVLQGRSLYSITKQWREQGITGPYGHTWTGTKLRKLLLNPRNRGALIYLGEEVTDSIITPLVDDDTFHAVAAILSDEQRRVSPGRQTRVTLLAGIATCACGEPMRSGANTQRGKTIPLYICATRSDGTAVGTHPSIRRHIADSLVLGAIYPWMLWLRREGGDLQLSGGTNLGPLRAKLAELRNARGNVQAMAEFEGADLDAIKTRLRELGTEIAHAETALAEAQASTAEGSLLHRLHTEVTSLEEMEETGTQFLDLWNSWPLELQRQVVGLFETVIHPGRGKERVKVTRGGAPLPTFRRDIRTGELTLHVPPQ